MLLFLVALLLAMAACGIKRLFITRPDLADQYALGPYRTLITIVSTVTGIFPFSLTELFVLIALLTILPLVVFYIIRLIKRRWRWRRLVGTFLLLSSIGFLLFTWFMALHGFNYERYPLSVTLELEEKPREKEALESAMSWLMKEAALARSLLDKNENGVATSSLSPKEILRHASGAYARLGTYYPQLTTMPESTIKAVYFSRPWSYTGITGIYNPIFAESNINIDQPLFVIPFTALHEAAHVGGYAREDEANFLAFLSGICHPMPEYRYASLHMTLTYVATRLYRVDSDRYFISIDKLDSGVATDLHAQRVYWKAFQGPVRTVSSAVNHTYLRTQGQTDGLESYGRMVDLLLAFHDKYGDMPVGLVPLSLTKVGP